jgi:hypothetical protein
MATEAGAMGLHRQVARAAFFRSGLLAIGAFTCTSWCASANQLVHMKRLVWGCVDPNVALNINDLRDPRRFDAQWVARTSAEGQCVTISTRSVWEPLSVDHNGLTYVAYRGTTGRPGSFWVPTTEIVLSALGETTPLPPPSAPTEPARIEAPQVIPAPRLPVEAPTAEVPALPVAPTQPPGQEPTQASTQSITAAQSSPSDSPSKGGNVVVVIIVALLLVTWGVRRMSRRPKQSNRRPKVETKRATSVPTRPVPGVAERMAVRNVVAELRVTGPVATARSGGNGAIWHPPGTAVSFSGVVVADGMIYVGRTVRRGDNDASFLDPSLPIARSSASAGALGYWPSYGAITPECRRRYLEWLASGKRDPDAPLGYVFLYFYGLERRLLLEEPAADEVRMLVGEIKRLRTIYAGSASFEGYSRRLVEAVGFLRASRGSAMEPHVPDLEASPGDMPLALKVAIAREVIAGRPLGFELSAAALFGLRDFWSGNRHATGKARHAFLALLRARFQKAYPTGFPLRNRKDSHLQLHYRGASAGLHLDLASILGMKDLPDPPTLTWTKLLTHAGMAATEIASYAKVLAYHPARANSLIVLTSCPAELRDAVATEARSWLAGLPSPAAVTFGELAGHAIGTSTGKWTIRHRRDVGAALAAVGYAMEPDPEDGIERIEDGTVVQVFRCLGGTKSRALEVASVAAMFVAAVGRTLDGGIEAAAELWLSKLPSRISLSPDEMTRVRARLVWFGVRGVALAKAKKTLRDSTVNEREFCAWSATVAAGATGDVGKPQVAILEAIHDALDVPRSALYSGLHAGIAAATASASEPVLVSEEVAEAVHPIPRPVVAAGSANTDHLDRIRAETDRVSRMLADIFVEEEQPLELAAGSGDGPLAGLDAGHAAFLTELLSRPEWKRDEFDEAAAAAGLMPEGAMETINEWSFDRHGDALLEDGETVVVNHALLKLETAAADR